MNLLRIFRFLLCMAPMALLLACRSTPQPVWPNQVNAALQQFKDYTLRGNPAMAALGLAEAERLVRAAGDTEGFLRLKVFEAAVASATAAPIQTLPSVPGYTDAHATLRAVFAFIENPLAVDAASLPEPFADLAPAIAAADWERLLKILQPEQDPFRALWVSRLFIAAHNAPAATDFAIALCRRWAWTLPLTQLLEVRAQQYIAEGLPAQAADLRQQILFIHDAHAYN